MSYRLDIILRLIRNNVLSLQLVKGEEEAVRGGALNAKQARTAWRYRSCE